LRVSTFFPRCYDLSDSKQAADFLQDFNQTAILSLLKLVYQAYSTEELNNLTTEYITKKKSFATPTTFLRQFQSKCKKMDAKVKANDKVRMAYRFGKDYLKKTSGKENYA